MTVRATVGAVVGVGAVVASGVDVVVVD